MAEGGNDYLDVSNMLTKVNYKNFSKELKKKEKRISALKKSRKFSRDKIAMINYGLHTNANDLLYILSYYTFIIESPMKLYNIVDQVDCSPIVYVWLLYHQLNNFLYIFNNNLNEIKFKVHLDFNDFFLFFEKASKDEQMFKFDSKNSFERSIITTLNTLNMYNFVRLNILTLPEYILKDYIEENNEEMLDDYTEEEKYIYFIYEKIENTQVLTEEELNLLFSNFYLFEKKKFSYGKNGELKKTPEKRKQKLYSRINEIIDMYKRIGITCEFIEIEEIKYYLTGEVPKKEQVKYYVEGNIPEIDIIQSVKPLEEGTLLYNLLNLDYNYIQAFIRNCSKKFILTINDNDAFNHCLDESNEITRVEHEESIRPILPPGLMEDDI